ncbi:gliding motility-associated protein GldE [Robiginitalea sp. SP8]|uniref:Putative transmembrane CorC/HlyC family transporter associated protein n=1 Tax=Robiginitalea biformata (strain ATCC BAA-864 / DSM 15991 / KCTC 12146 / HTCC2501) TaxID=313596 RepID=A4CIT6_ROBBH|nr:MULTISPECIES: gliding motility-associated protein GldE [Robiginitalea]EAR16844.1 putative transmembrane CorC/HlyC family transporter associated protein [Robiginitalea biformata HTCC2501]MDC6352951.1 gliding motility-associated protein GldE [Robiginitalea sp. PM2]MDC6373882.1 gliding motility-associated protein GldE [Robiginitalea sp. SP8]
MAIFQIGADVLLISKLALLVVLLGCSALVSGAEVAFFGLSQTELNAFRDSGSTPGGIVYRLLQKPKKLLATILIANNAINIGIVLLLTDVGETLFATVDQVYLGVISLRFVLEIVLATFLILLFGEILPKIYANRNREVFALRMAYPLKALDFLFTPLTAPMRAGTILLYRRLGKQKSNLSVDHLSQALELTSEGDTTREEQKILQGIVSFGNTDTKQVMRPRIDIFALDEGMKFPEVLEEIRKNGYSRIPVFSENMDNVLGVLYVKDLLPYLDRKTFNWITLIREPFFVPENKKLDDLLLEFQNKKNHLAVVVDEFGGTSGIVTLEDVIEEIVGDISDEFDDEDLIYSKLDDKNIVFEGKTNLKDFYRVARIPDTEPFEQRKGESETIAGFVLEISGNFPKRGETVLFNEYRFLVESVDKKRLKQIKITLPDDA